MEEADEDDVL